MAHESVDSQAMEEEFKRTKVMEIAADFWMIGGYIGQPASVKKSSSNSFIMLDGDSLILVDPGFHAYFRKKQLEIIRRYAGKGVKRLILLLTHGHFDHIANNDVILEAGIPDVHFLLQEPGVEIVDLNVYAKDIDALMEYYDARSYEPFYDARTEFAGIRTLAERAEILVGAERGDVDAVQLGSAMDGHALGESHRLVVNLHRQRARLLNHTLIPDARGKMQSARYLTVLILHLTSFNLHLACPHDSITMASPAMASKRQTS
jgi:hypothetical protein